MSFIISFFVSFSEYDPCESSPCGMGAVCKVDECGEYACYCEDGFETQEDGSCMGEFVLDLLHSIQ